MLPPTAVILLLCLPLAFATESREAAVNASTPRTCYSCEGINCQRTTLQDVTVKCTDLLDTCVTVFEGFMVSERGCQLELSLAAQSKCDARDIQCQKCIGELCNNQGRIDFQCIQCSGLENADCNSAVDNISPSRCPAPTASNAYCYVKSVDTHLQRGCSLSVKEQQSCLKDSDCSLCLPEDAHGSTACNSYALDMKSGAARGPQLLGLLLGVLSLVAVQGSR